MPVADAPVAAGGGLWLLLGVLLPVLAVTATAFAKISVVLGALRGGLGLPEVLPAPVLTGLAALLAAVVMLPTAQRAAEAAGAFEDNATGYADAAARALAGLGGLSRERDPCRRPRGGAGRDGKARSGPPGRRAAEPPRAHPGFSRQRARGGLSTRPWRYCCRF
jgi:hypothetical protein